MKKSKQTEPIVLKEKEIDIEQYFRRQCAIRGWECLKLDPTNKRGIQDRMVLPGEGIVIFAEIKRKKGPVRGNQLKRYNKMIEKGYEAYILDSVQDIDEVIARTETIVTYAKAIEDGLRS